MNTSFWVLCSTGNYHISPNIKCLKTKTIRAQQLLRVVAHPKWGADLKTLLNLYRALVRSQLDYGSFIYRSARKSYIKKLDPIHHEGLWLVLGAFKASPVDSLYTEHMKHPYNSGAKNWLSSTALNWNHAHPNQYMTASSKVKINNNLNTRKEQSNHFAFGWNLSSKNQPFPLQMHIKASSLKFHPG